MERVSGLEKGEEGRALERYRGWLGGGIVFFSPPNEGGWCRVQERGRSGIYVL